MAGVISEILVDDYVLPVEVLLLDRRGDGDKDVDMNLGEKETREMEGPTGTSKKELLQKLLQDEPRKRREELDLIDRAKKIKEKNRLLFEEAWMLMERLGKPPVDGEMD